MNNLLDQIIDQDKVLSCTKCGLIRIEEDDLSVSGPHIKVVHKTCGTYIKFARKNVAARNADSYSAQRTAVSNMDGYDPTEIQRVITGTETDLRTDEGEELPW